ncbi:nucleotidyltransferase domain-containing protein [uncultured Methanospirillum sp.]|uniref:nucleotidyltransferase domain-containing protein n=1 Tax=uncultured Methanospirillum sp. TaxID=262503 RepID=UPI0029C74035|nr:nucleotidyltransferase domain-containing protein [uncultured Methanospirillum sp.]
MDTRVTSLIDDLLSETRKLGIETTTLVLFGSQSDGTAIDGSDVDIALISPSFENLNSLQRRKRIKPALYKIIERYQIPVDLILLTPEEYTNENSIRMSFIRNGVSIPIPA